MASLAKQVQHYVSDRLKGEDRSLRDLAESVGVNRQSFWFSLKKTKKGMTLASLEKLAEAFGLQPWEFLREVEQHETENKHMECDI